MIKFILGVMMKSVARDYADFDSTDGKDKWEYYAPVGSFKPNGYSLFDISGNIWGWCGNQKNQVFCGVALGIAM